MSHKPQSFEHVIRINIIVCHNHNIIIQFLLYVLPSCGVKEICGVNFLSLVLLLCFMYSSHCWALYLFFLWPLWPAHNYKDYISLEGLFSFYTYIHTCTRTHACAHACTHAQTHTHSLTCTRTCRRAHTHAHAAEPRKRLQVMFIPKLALHNITNIGPLLEQ